MNTKMNAIAMTLLMIASALAGCTSGDPDGDGTSGIDMEILNEMIDDNLQDFINNTSVTVNNHYYNNTTNNVDDTDNSISNYNGTSGGSSQMYAFTHEWRPSDHFELLGYDERIITVTNGAVENYSQGNPDLLFMTMYEGNVIQFEGISCEVAYNFGWLSHQEWEDFLRDNYGGHSQTYYIAEDLYRFWYHYTSDSLFNGGDRLDDNGQTPREQCGLNGAPYVHHTLFEIELESGEAIAFQSIPNYIDIELNCESGFLVSTLNSTSTYWGGHDDCLLIGKAKIYGSHQWDSRYINWNDGNMSSDTQVTMPEDIAAWWSTSWWYEYEETTEHVYSNVPNSFSVYFTLLNVEPYSFE